jgi:protein O-mannosyl-transferase
VQVGALSARLPAIGVAAATYLRLLVWPSDLHLERFVGVLGWSGRQIALAWAPVLVTIAVLVWTARRVPGGALLLALAALSYAPVSGIVPVYPAIADRALFAAEHFLYLPLLGLVPLVVGAVAGAWPRSAMRVAPAVVVIMLVAWGAVVVDRNRDWRDEETIYRDTITYSPPANRVYFNLGNLLLAQGRIDEAENIYEIAIVRDYHDAEVHLNLGIIQERKGNVGVAEGHYRYAIANDPKLKEAYRALAGLLVRRGKLDDARKVLEQGGFPTR